MNNEELLNSLEHDYCEEYGRCVFCNAERTELQKYFQRDLGLLPLCLVCEKAMKDLKIDLDTNEEG